MVRRLILACLFVAFVSATARGQDEEEWRTWTSKAGTTIEASVVSIDGDSVTLKRKDDGNPLTVKIDQLSDEDRTFLEDSQKPPATSVPGIDAEPGLASGPIACGDGAWNYHLYLPKAFNTGKKWPVWFIMSPGGGSGGGAMDRYLDGAELFGCIVALSVESKNGFDDSEVAMEAMVKHVFENLPVYDELGFSSGFSGGSRMAFLLAERDKRISGVLACGSGDGVYQKGEEFRPARLRKSTYVYSLIGTNCFNRSGAVTTHRRLSDDNRLRFFPGGHDWANATLISEGMARVLGEALKQRKSDEYEAERNQFAKAMSSWMDDMIRNEPWEAAFWAGFLADFPGPPEVSEHAATVAADLKSDPRVAKAAAAEKDIAKFVEKHYDKHISVDEGKVPDPAREEEATKLSEEYKGLPHAYLLRKLGGAS